MTMIHFNNFQDLWESTCLDLYYNGEETLKCQDTYSIGSYFGKMPRGTREKLAQTFTLTQPRNRVLLSEIKPINFSYLFANFLFLFSKEKTIEFIDFYNNKGRLFTDDGKTLNAPLGYRILSKTNQLERIKELINSDLSTRRAVIQILEPSDLSGNVRDVPCVNNIQLFVRNHKLNMIVNMRSQSAFTLLPYDIFIFTMFLEALSCYLGFELGDYIHFSNSLHVYEDELSHIAEMALLKDSISYEMRPMKQFNLEIIETLFVAEAEIRNMIQRDKKFSDEIYSKFNLDDYWTAFLKCLISAYINPKKGIANINSILELNKYTQESANAER